MHIYKQVYTFSQGKLKVVTNKQYTTIKNNYELTFDTNSEIRPAQDNNDIKVIIYVYTCIHMYVYLYINVCVY